MNQPKNHTGHNIRDNDAFCSTCKLFVCAWCDETAQIVGERNKDGQMDAACHLHFADFKENNTHGFDATGIQNAALLLPGIIDSSALIHGAKKIPKDIWERF